MAFLLNLYIHVLSHLVMANSLRPHGLQPARLLSPRSVASKNTGVGCYFLLHLYIGIFCQTWATVTSSNTSSDIPSSSSSSRVPLVTEMLRYFVTIHRSLQFCSFFKMFYFLCVVRIKEFLFFYLQVH